MSFITDLLGKSSKDQNSSGSSSSNTNQHATQTANSSQNTTSTQQQTQTGSSNSNVSSLDDATQNLLKTIMNQVSQTPTALSDSLLSATSGASPAIQAIQSLAANAPVNQENLVNNAVEAARSSFESGEGNATEQGTQLIGSADNSASQLLKEKTNRDEATTLGNVATQANIQGLNTQANLSTAAAQALQSLGLTSEYGSMPLENLASILKGANTSETSSNVANLTGQSTVDTQTLSKLISDLTQNTSGQTSENTEETNHPSLLQVLGGIMNLGKA